MKRAAEVKPSVRCSEEPVSGGGSICAVSITKRAKLEEPEAAHGITRRSPKLLAADGITRRSPKLLAADGVGIAEKRARKPEKPSKKEKGAEEKSRRSNQEKSAGEKTKQPNKVMVVRDISMEEKIMAKLAGFEKKRAREKNKRSNQEKRIQKMLMRMEKIASKVEKQVAGDGTKKEKRTKKPEGGEVADNEVIEEMMPDNEAGGVKKKKKKVVTWRLSQELLEYLRTKEVMGLLATDASLLLRAKMAEPLFDQRLKEDVAAEFHENREFDAHVLYQYRTYGFAEIEEEVSDEEDDVEAEEP